MAAPHIYRRHEGNLKLSVPAAEMKTGCLQPGLLRPESHPGPVRTMELMCGGLVFREIRTGNERNFHRKGYSSCVTDTGVS